MNADIQRAASGMQVAAAFQPPPTRADYYDYQQRTQRMGPQTMMGAGVAPTTVSQYPQGGYPPGYQPGYNEGGYDNGDGEQGGGRRRWLPWTIAGVVLVAAIVAAVLLLHGGGGGTYVPAALVGESQATAVAQVKAAGLHPSVHPAVQRQRDDRQRDQHQPVRRLQHLQGRHRHPLRLQAARRPSCSRTSRTSSTTPPRNS